MSGDVLTPGFAAGCSRPLRFIGGFDSSGTMLVRRATLIERSCGKLFHWSRRSGEAVERFLVNLVPVPDLRRARRADGRGVPLLVLLNARAGVRGYRIVT